jgi:WD40 repeat protein
MFTGGYDYRIIHWNIDTGEILESIQEQASYISSIAVDSNGGFLYASSADNSVKKWKVSLQKLNSTVTVDDGLATTATTKNNGATKSMFYNIFMGLVFLFQ